MDTKYILIALILISLTFPDVALAESSYGKIDVYYNGKYLPGTEIAKPTLKIGEPFSVAIEMTMYQYCKVYVELSDLGTYSGMNNFMVIDGPSNLGQSYDKIFMENETYTFEWTLKPTDEWGDGAMPVNFYYSILLPSDSESVVNSEFTVAVPYITTEHYEGDTTPTTTTDPESPTSTDNPTTPSTPAFTLLAAALTLTIAARRS